MAAEFSRDQLAAVSDGVSKLWAKYHGRGPVSAKTYAGDDHLFTVMQGGLSQEELTLVRHGRADLVRQVRVVFETELREDMLGLVEEATGQPPVDYASQFLPDAGITVEIFVFGDVGESG